MLNWRPCPLDLGLGFSRGAWAFYMEPGILTWGSSFLHQAQNLALSLSCNRDTFQCMINITSKYFSFIWELWSPKLTIHQKKLIPWRQKTSILQFFFLSCVWKEPNVTDSQQINSPKQSPLQSIWAIQNWNFRDDTTDNKLITITKCDFFLDPRGEFFLYGWKNSNLKKVCHNFPVCWKKLPNFQEIILGGCCVGGWAKFATFQHTLF